jgi:hypothetical protein
MTCSLGQEENINAGCSKRPFSKAAASEDREAYPLGYVEDLNDARTPLTAFFSILLSFGFAVIQMPMLPVEPGMAKFVGKNIAPPSHRQALAKINSFRSIVPDAVSIRVPTIHVGIGKLTHGNSIAEGQDDSRG